MFQSKTHYRFLNLSILFLFFHLDQFIKRIIFGYQNMENHLEQYPTVINYPSI